MVSRRAAAVLGVLVLVLTSGCVAVAPPTNEPDPEALFNSTFVYGEELEDVTGEVTVTVNGSNGTSTERLRVAERPYVDYRDEVLESSIPSRVGDQYVSNASTTWWYYPQSGMAQYIEQDEPFDSDAVRADRAEMANESLERYEYDLEYRGTEEIADREAHVLDVEAKAETVERGISLLVGDTEFVYAVETAEVPEDPTIVEQKIWIDTEYDYPLKERLVYEDSDGERYELVQQYETVSFNEGLDDETFTFEPPEDAVVQELPAE